MSNNFNIGNSPKKRKMLRNFYISGTNNKSTNNVVQTVPSLSSQAFISENLTEISNPVIDDKILIENSEAIVEDKNLIENTEPTNNKKPTGDNILIVVIENKQAIEEYKKTISSVDYFEKILNEFSVDINLKEIILNNLNEKDAIKFLQNKTFFEQFYKTNKNINIIRKILLFTELSKNEIIIKHDIDVKLINKDDMIFYSTLNNERHIQFCNNIIKIKQFAEEYVNNFIINYGAGKRERAHIEILGMPLTGKTTLARFILPYYIKEITNKHFTSHFFTIYIDFLHKESESVLKFILRYLQELHFISDEEAEHYKNMEPTGRGFSYFIFNLLSPKNSNIYIIMVFDEVQVLSKKDLDDLRYLVKSEDGTGNFHCILLGSTQAVFLQKIEDTTQNGINYSFKRNLLSIPKQSDEFQIIDTNMINHCLFKYNYLNEKEIEMLWSKHHASLTKVAEEKSLNKLTMLEAVENVTAVVFNIYKRDLHEHLCNQQIPLLQDLLHGVCDSSKLDSFKNYPVLKYLVVENKGKCKLMDELLEVFILKHYFFDNDGYCRSRKESRM